MYGETYGQRHVDAMIYALKDARESLLWLIDEYPNDPNIKSHKDNLRKIYKALKGFE